MSHAQPPQPADPYQWLEEVDSDRALTWVKQQNQLSTEALRSRPDYETIRQQLLAILNSKEKIPRVIRHGEYFYNLWTDDKHQRGLWRRTTLDGYRQSAPPWETVLDIDALGEKEKTNWVWAGAAALGPNNKRFLIQLSRGGADATEVREFDAETKEFVADGFKLPEAKTHVDWLDQDTIFVATNFGPGTLTSSGYPRLIKRWRRGTPLENAPTVFEGRVEDVSAWVSVDRTLGYERTLFGRSPDFYTSEVSIQNGEQLQRIDKPVDATLSFHGPWLLLELRSALQQGDHTFPSGSLLVAPAARYLQGDKKCEALFEPTATRSLASYSATRTRILLNILDNVASRIEVLHHVADQWQRQLVDAPYPGKLSLTSLTDSERADDPLSENYLLSYTDFLTPETLTLAHTANKQRETLKQQPAFFNSEGMRVEQRFATSQDGTRVPYFVVWPKGATANALNPTLLYGYGGFQISLQPWYPADYGVAWSARGGVLVVANIRGGGEFGPAWHKAACNAEKQRSYDDFIAVAEDLIKQRITTPQQLGIMGGSNGGLLVGATFVQRPELFNAVVCQVPLLDMRRYHLLLAGASWMAEYGNPDVPEQWAWISKYSPYQNVQADRKYPKVLFATSTRDDRVHPGHARKMAARMIEQQHPVFYYENIEGGHGGAADNTQRAQLKALEFSYLWLQIGASK